MTNSTSSSPALRVVYSQDVHQLAAALSEELFSRDSSSALRPFETCLIVVAHQGMKEDLMRQWAADEKLGIAAGVQILPLSEAIMEIAKRHPEGDLLGKIPSQLELTVAITEAMLTLKDTKEGEGLQEYAATTPSLMALATQLVLLFEQYGLFACQSLEPWLEKKEWQQEVWRRVFSRWNYPLQFFPGLKKNAPPLRVVLFGFSYLPWVHLDFFASLNASCYLFSPCSLFWADHVSDREFLYIDRNAEKRGVKPSIRQEMGRYRSQDNPLLANWGKLGRQLLVSLEALVAEEEHVYWPPYPERLLGRLQGDILGTLEATQAWPWDDSIQIHTAPSRMREVEAMRTSLEALCEEWHQEGRPLGPDEIVVVASDIEAYAPLLGLVFQDSHLPLSVEKTVSPSNLLLGLLDLAHHGYRFEELEALLQTSTIQQQWGLAEQEVPLLLSLLRRASIRESLVGTPHSWQEGLSRLIEGLTCSPESTKVPITLSQVSFLNPFLEKFLLLTQTLSSLTEPRCLAQWALFLRSIHEGHTSTDSDSIEFLATFEALVATTSISDALWAFVDVYALLHRVAAQSAARSHPTTLGAVLCTSVDRAPLKGARVIYCLGLDEQSFPRTEEKSSLDTLKRSAQEEVPTRSQRDRYLFLEMVLKAKEALFLSYQRVDPHDSREQAPSLLIAELCSYLQQHGVSQPLMTVDHPLSPFDPLYFSISSSLPHADRSHYQMARAQQQKTTPSPFFIPSAPTALSAKVSLSELKLLARHPFQLYCNKTLQLYFTEEEESEKKAFVLSGLQKYHLAARALDENLSASGALPSGQFGKVAMLELEVQQEKRTQALQIFGLTPQEVRSIQLVDCLEREATLHYRPWIHSRCKEQNVIIQGTLEGVTEKGLFFRGSKDLADLVKIWPQYLVYLHLYPQEQQLLASEEEEPFSLPVLDPQAALSEYLEFYHAALQAPCPFFVQASALFLKADKEGFMKELAKPSEDPYWQWVQRRKLELELAERFQESAALLAPVLRRIDESI